MSTPTCPNCEATLRPTDLADGWCDSCGKQLPGYLTTQPSAPRRDTGLQERASDYQDRYPDDRGGFADLGRSEDDLSRIHRRPLASLGARLGGAIIDGFVALVFLGPGYVIMLSGEQTKDEGQEMLGIVAVLLGGVILAVIQITLLSMHGQSLGKKAAGTRIVNVQDGSNPGFVGAVLLRSFVPGGAIGAIPCVGGIFSLVDILSIFGEERRCLHDQIASTRVVVA